MFSSRPEMDTVAVSEVIGQILIFGILSTVLILTLVGFNVAKVSAEERAIDLRAESAAQRVAAVAVQAALFAEENAGREITFSGFVDLPQDLEGRSYFLDLGEDTIDATVPATGSAVSVRLLRTGVAPDLVVCDQPEMPGGPVNVRVVTTTANPASCVGFPVLSTPKQVLYLEVAS